MVTASVPDHKVREATDQFTALSEVPAERAAAVVDESESHRHILACSHPFPRVLRAWLGGLFRLS